MSSGQQHQKREEPDARARQGETEYPEAPEERALKHRNILLKGGAEVDRREERAAGNRRVSADGTYGWFEHHGACMRMGSTYRSKY